MNTNYTATLLRCETTYSRRPAGPRWQQVDNFGHGRDGRKTTPPVRLPAQGKASGDMVRGNNASGVGGN